MMKELTINGFGMTKLVIAGAVAFVLIGLAVVGYKFSMLFEMLTHLL